MAQTVKNLPAMRETWVQPLVQEGPWRRGYRPCTCALLSHFSRVQLLVTPWTVARQAPLSMGVLQARILEWVAVSSRGSSQPRDQTRDSYVSCIDRRVLYHWRHLGSLGYIPWDRKESDMTEQLTFSLSHLSLTPVQA